MADVDAETWYRACDVLRREVATLEDRLSRSRKEVKRLRVAKKSVPAAAAKPAAKKVKKGQS